MNKIIDVIKENFYLVLLFGAVTIMTTTYTITDFLKTKTAMSQGYVQKVEGRNIIWVKPTNSAIEK